MCIRDSGIGVSAVAGGGIGTDTQTITLDTPSTLTTSTTDAVTVDSHTHAITNSDDTSSAVAAVILSANSIRPKIKLLRILIAIYLIKAIVQKISLKYQKMFLMVESK